MRFGPTINEERLVLLSERARAWYRAGLIDETTRNRVRESTPTRWKVSSPLVRVVFFVLTLGCVGALYFLLAVDWTYDPLTGVLTGLVSIALAEFLIMRQRFFHLGPEEALYLGGLIAIVTDFRDTQVELVLLIAFAAVMAGIRVHNPFFIVAASLLVGYYLFEKLDSGAVAAAWCIAVAFIAFVLLTRTIARPWWDQTLVTMILILPPAAFLFQIAPARSRVSPATMVGFAVLAFLFIAAGVRARFHSPMLSGMILLGLVIWKLSEHLALPGEAQLIGWGLLGLAIAVGIEQGLRRSRSGITARRLLDPEGFGILEAASVGILAAGSSHVEPDRTAQLETGEGEFGGGGATGHY